MTRYAFSAHTYPDEPERWLQPPVGKYLEIIRCAMEPHKGVRQIDLCCGLGFGKTLLAIQIAVLKLDRSKGTKILFLEPDWDRVDSIFLEAWYEHVPPELYRHEIGRHKIVWLPTGATLRYRPRVLTGSKSMAKDRRRGPEYTDVIDDETAIGFDRETTVNTLARVRAPGDCLTYITLTTPKVGPYGRFLKRGGNIVFKARTADNHYLLERQPDYETNLRAAMSKEQARRELDAELVALEGRLWPHADLETAWPRGNRHDQWKQFRRGEPWWLFCDLGSATGAYLVVQKTNSKRGGRRLYEDDDNVWVAVADLCPMTEANASRSFQLLRQHFGTPVAVVGGKDLMTRGRVTGNTVARFVQTVWGNVDIIDCDETVLSKQTQYDMASYLVCSTENRRRFTVAKDFVSLDEDSHRGIREMFEEDAWPPEDKRRPGDVLPKNKDITVQHIRDSFIMGAGAVMSTPEWQKTLELAR